MKRRLLFSVWAFINTALGSAIAAVSVAEHVLPAAATSWFEVGAGVLTNGGIEDNRQAQTFVPTTSGYLAAIEFNAYRTLATDVDLRVSVTSVLAGQPSTVLESILVPRSLVNTDALTYGFLLSGSFSQTATASGSLHLDAGVTYALVFSTDTNDANYRIYGDFSGYTQGDILQFQNTGPYDPVPGADLLFRVTANQSSSPALAIALSGNQITLSWSQSGFVVEENSNVNDSAGWTNVTDATSSPVTVNISPGGSRFYRLRSQ